MYYRLGNISCSYKDKVVFDSVTIEIKDKEKIALLGRNGCGKSTLFKAIVKEIEYEEGSGDDSFGEIKQGDPKIGYLSQHIFDDLSISLLDEIKSHFKQIFDIENRLNIALEKMQLCPSENNIESYYKIYDEFEFNGGFLLETEINIVLHGLGFKDEDKTRKLETFSGGEKTRIALLNLLLSKPDILLLDEPTNNLDIESIEWLENYLKNYPKAVVVISHDRMFIDRVCSKIYEIEWGESKVYHGNYSHFIKLKKEQYLKQEKDHSLQKKEINRLQRIVDRFLYKPTKSKLAKSVRKKIEKMELIKNPNPFNDKSFKGECLVKHKSAEEVLVCDNLKIGYNSQNVLADLSFKLLRGQKLGIIGPNGTGKSSFIKTILGLNKSLGGRFFFGDRVEVSYFDQNITDFDPKLSIFEAFSNEFPEYTPQEVRNALGSFQISGDDVFKSISELSGGEKVRFALCKVLKARPNLLILDEPTNHVDIIGKETLETILKNYDGTLIIVSHDRYMINSICDSLLVFDKQGAKYIASSYNEYYEKLNEPKKIIKENKKVIKKEEIKLPKKSYKNKITNIENEIKDLEEVLVNLKDRFNDEDIVSSYIELNKLEKDIRQIEEELTNLYNKWEDYINKEDELDNY